VSPCYLSSCQRIGWSFERSHSHPVPFCRTGGGGKKYQGLDNWTRSLDRLTDHMEQPYTSI
jgi:hypothetical protein